MIASARLGLPRVFTRFFMSREDFFTRSEWDFIRLGLDAGRSRTEIMQALLTADWDVNLAAEYLLQQEEPQEEPGSDDPLKLVSGPREQAAVAAHPPASAGEHQAAGPHAVPSEVPPPRWDVAVAASSASQTSKAPVKPKARTVGYLVMSAVADKHVDLVGWHPVPWATMTRRFGLVHGARVSLDGRIAAMGILLQGCSSRREAETFWAQSSHGRDFTSMPVHRPN